MVDATVMAIALDDSIGTDAREALFLSTHHACELSKADTGAVRVNETTIQFRCSSLLSWVTA